MSDKHLATGDALPPLSKDKLRIYSMRFCPYAQRTRLVLAYKGIPHETVNVNLRRKPDWFLERNPLGLVPVLEYNDKIVYESAICDEFLDDIYPENKLFPSDPYERARAKILMARYEKAISIFYKFILGDEGAREKAAEDFPNAMETFEEALTGKFFGGDSPGMVDIHFWPWIERIPVVLIKHAINPLPENRFPKLTKWITDMKETPMVKATLLSPGAHLRYVRSHVNDPEPDYDMAV